VGRSTVQARDVFDLGVLFAKAGGKVDALRAVRADIPKGDRAGDGRLVRRYKSQFQGLNR